MRANKPRTKILVDGGDPDQTLRIKELIGFVDGQTTNPSLKVREEWAAQGTPLPDDSFIYHGIDSKGQHLKPIEYKELDLNAPWESFDVRHELTTKGIKSSLRITKARCAKQLDSP
jgi:hypothetical protein